MALENRQKEKKCSICGKSFVAYSNNASLRAICSFDCAQKNHKINQDLLKERRKKIPKQTKCRFCGKLVETNEYCPINFCGGRGGECVKAFMSEKRKGRKNPSYRSGFYVGGENTHNGKHLHACSKFKKEFLKKHDYLYCESCGVNQNGTPKFETHHIYYASLWPRHKELHNPKNLILLCIRCHNEFHSSKRKEEFKKLEKERGLKTLFLSK